MNPSCLCFSITGIDLGAHHLVQSCGYVSVLQTRCCPSSRFDMAPNTWTQGDHFEKDTSSTKAATVDDRALRLQSHMDIALHCKLVSVIAVMIICNGLPALTQWISKSFIKPAKHVGCHRHTVHDIVEPEKSLQMVLKCMQPHTMQVFIFW